MAKLPANERTLVHRIDKAIEEWNKHQAPRTYLGASAIGRKCDREIYFGWKDEGVPEFSGRMLRLFNRGHREEPVFIKLLEFIGLEVLGQEVEFEEFDGVLKGHCDALVRDPSRELLGKKTHVAEFKTHNDKSFKKLVKEGLQESKPEHYAQMQMYMGGLGYKRGLYCAVNKNDDSLFIDRIHYDREAHEYYLARARLIIDSDNDHLPPRISIDRTYWVCRYCNYNTKCYG